MSTIFLLSPARCDGRRAKILLSPKAAFELAERIRTPTGAPIGETFAFLSGLYFRGKLAYAHAFGRHRAGGPSAFVITTDRGLVTTDTQVTRDDLLAFAGVDLATAGERYVAPLERDITRLAADATSRFVLLGSIATGKYADALTRVLSDRLLFPIDFVGRGDMSRGGLLLRCVAEGKELEYAPVLGAVRKGKRPAKLAPLPKKQKG
ncbi:MAG TPA: hypothetical protein VIP11_06910 [Gemmatimonadaceae bacterium]